MKFFSLFLLLANSIYHADAFDPFYKSLILRQVKFDAIKNAQQRRTLPQGPRSWPEANTRPTTCQAELDQILNLQQEQKNLAENYEVLQHQIVDSQNKNVDLENLIEAYKVEIDQKDEKIAFCESSNSVVELGPVNSENLQDIISYHDQHNFELQMEVEELKNKIKNQEAELENAKAAAEKEIFERDIRLQELQNKIDAAAISTDTSGTTINFDAKLLEGFHDPEIVNFQGELENMKAKYQEQDQYLEQVIFEHEIELEELKNKYQKLIDVESQSTFELEMDLEVARLKLVKMELFYQKKLVFSDEMMENLNNEIINLYDIKNELEKTNQDVTEKFNQLKQDHQLLNDVNIENEQQLEQIALSKLDQDAKIKSLVQETVTKDLQIIDLEAENFKLQEEMEKLKNDLQSLINTKYLEVSNK